MNSADGLRILPEIILTIAGVLLMLIDASLPAAVTPPLLVVFIALEISSISTYILAGYRKRSAQGPESAIKYFLLGSFATAFLLYGIALIFGATGTTQIYEIAQRASGAQNHSLVVTALM